MLAGAWGARAGELLARAAGRLDAPIHEFGDLAMLAPPELTTRRWYCWMFGEPEYRQDPLARSRSEAHEDLSSLQFALSELGERSCELLCGRFVLVMFDRERNQCLITRDQLGAQPLVHTSTADGMLFAEHERDLLELLPRTPSPDRLALLQWIENGIVPAGRTLYEGLHRLPAGHRMVTGEGRPRVERWWSPRYEGVELPGEGDLAESVREAAFAAVGRAAGSGSRRPAVKLSGGLDSACVAAGLAANGLAGERGLAIGGTFSGYPVSDESDLIAATARHTHLPLERVEFDASSSMLAPAIAHIARWRLPPATPNLFLWQPVMARARECGVELMLDGEGGDELFGCAPYLIADMVRSARLRTAWALTGRVPGIGPNPAGRIRLRVLRHYGVRPLVPSAVQRRREQRAVASSRSIVPHKDARALVDLRVTHEQGRRDGPLWWRFQVESLVEMRDLLDMGAHFRREDADEAIARRHPFLFDLQLIEAMLRVPPRSQFDPIRDRLLLREGISGLIPEAVRARYAKSHFSPLVLAGIAKDELALVEPLRRADAPVREYVASEALDKRIGIAPAERSMLGVGTLWRVAIADRWLSAQARQLG
jgi:asparagine synthetase B (glutamine-hydrolysing)